MFIVMAGLPASGKSTVAKNLQQHLSCVLLDKDTVRAFLFNQYTDYTRVQDDLCMQTIYNTACYLARNHPQLPIILDGRTYSRRYQLAAVEQAATNASTELKLIECICSDATAEKRLNDPQNNHPAADRDFALYQRSKAAAQCIDKPKLVLETDKLSLPACTQTALAYLESDS